MRKIINFLSVLIVTAGVMVAMNGVVLADDIVESVPIDEAHFPGKYIRLKVKDYDINRDNVLSKEEIENVKKLTVDCESGEGVYTADGELFFDEKEYSRIDLKGVSIFKNVETISISAYSTGAKDVQYGFDNFDELYKLKNVDYIDISECNDLRKYDFSQFPKLKKLRLNNVKGVDELNLGQTDAIEEITLMGVKGKAKIDLSGQKNISVFDAGHLELGEIKFGNNSKIKNIELIDLKGVNQINISGLNNLESFRLGRAKDLKKINVGKLDKLKVLTAINCKKLNNIDVSKCTNLKRVFISSAAISKFKISPKQKTKTVCVDSCNKLKKLNIRNKNIKYLYIYNSGIKKIDVRKMKNLRRIEIDKSQKIIGKTEAKISYR